MRPKPTTPSVLPASSTPSHFERSQRPLTSAAWACGTLRAIDINNAIVCSAAETMFDSGALVTITPAFVAASTSTLSKPTPARPTTSRPLTALSTAASTLVALRTMSACAPCSAAMSASPFNPSCTSTTWPAARRRSRPASAISSVTRTRAIPPSWRVTGIITNSPTTPLHGSPMRMCPFRPRCTVIVRGIHF